MSHDAYLEEVLSLHRFLERWMRGEVSRGDGVPARLERALANDFVVVHPDGTRAGKTEVLERFAAAYGKKPPGYALALEPVAARQFEGALGLVTYHEAHRGEPGRERTSTAVLQRSAGNRIAWLFLQETPYRPPPG